MLTASKRFLYTSVLFLEKSASCAALEAPSESSSRVNLSFCSHSSETWLLITRAVIGTRSTCSAANITQILLRIEPALINEGAQALSWSPAPRWVVALASAVTSNKGTSPGMQGARRPVGGVRGAAYVMSL